MPTSSELKKRFLARGMYQEYDNLLRELGDIVSLDSKYPSSIFCDICSDKKSHQAQESLLLREEKKDIFISADLVTRIRNLGGKYEDLGRADFQSMVRTLPSIPSPLCVSTSQ